MSNGGGVSLVHTKSCSLSEDALALLESLPGKVETRYTIKLFCRRERERERENFSEGRINYI